MSGKLFVAGALVAAGLAGLWLGVPRASDRAADGGAVGGEPALKAGHPEAANRADCEGLGPLCAAVRDASTHKEERSAIAGVLNFCLERGIARRMEVFDPQGKPLGPETLCAGSGPRVLVRVTFDPCPDAMLEWKPLRRLNAYQLLRKQPLP